MQELSPYTFIIAGSIILLLSFSFGAIAKKTNVPAVLMLIALGVGIQYLLKYFGFVDLDFFPILQILGIVGLIMIVLEAALELELKKEKVGLIFKSLIIALFGLVGSVGLAGLILYYLIPEMTWLQAFLYATPLSILSSAIIIPSVGNLTQGKKEFHIYESTFSDILGIMLFYFLLGMLEHHSPMEASGHVSGDPVLDFFVSLGLTIVVAIVASYVLLVVFQHIKGGPKLFLLIAVLLLLYSLGKKMHLSPLIIILVFGLFVSNSKLFFKGPLKKLLHPEKFKEMEHGLHVVTLETAFVIRTFFFVIFGASILLVSLASLKVAYVSLALLLSIYLVRFIFLRFFIGKDLNPQIWIAPRGLITVLLFYAIPDHQLNPNFDSGILLFIIIATGLIMTIGMIAATKNANKPIVNSVDADFSFDKVPLPKIKSDATSEK